MIPIVLHLADGSALVVACPFFAEPQSVRVFERPPSRVVAMKDGSTVTIVGATETVGGVRDLRPVSHEVLESPDEIANLCDARRLST